MYVCVCVCGEGRALFFRRLIMPHCRRRAPHADSRYGLYVCVLEGCSVARKWCHTADDGFLEGAADTGFLPLINDVIIVL